MDIEEAKKDLNNLIFTLEIKHLGGAEAIDTVLNELEKKDKVIDKIKFINDTNKPHKAQAKTKECIKQYFSEKVSDNKWKQ